LVNKPSKENVKNINKVKFQYGQHPTIDAIVNFLEINNLRDIVVVPTHKLGRLHLKETSILCSGFTQKHVYKSAKDFLVELKKLNIPNEKLRISGGRDQEWLLVEVGQIAVHFFVESFRKEQDLLEIWMNPQPPELEEEHNRYFNKLYKKH
jgi:ribosomal silencing factor RsfS